MTTQWLATPHTHAIGSTLYVETENSRRRATVIASKPGWVMLQWRE